MPSPPSKKKLACGVTAMSGGGQPVQLLRPGHRGVFDPVGHGPRAVFRGAVGDDVDREIDGAVTDGVGSDGPARRVGGLDFRPELLRFGLEIAGVAGVVRPAVAAVVLADRSRFAQQGAVQEHLRRAQRQEFVAKAAGDAQVEAGSCRVRRVLAVQGVQHVKDRHQLRPGVEPARGRCPLVGGQFHRAVADPAAADPRLGEAGDAFRGVVAGGPVQRVFDGLAASTAGSAAGSAAGPFPGPARWAGRRRRGRSRRRRGPGTTPGRRRPAGARRC